MGCGYSKRVSATLEDEHGAVNGDGGAQPKPCSVEPFVQSPELAEVMRKWTRLRGPSAHTRAASPVPTGQAPGKHAAAAGSATPRTTGDGCGGDTSVRRGAMTPRYTGPYPTVEELDLESRRLQDAMRALQREAHALDAQRLPAQHASAEGSAVKTQVGASVDQGTTGTTGTDSAAARVQGAAAGAVPEAGAATVSKGGAEAPAAGDKAAHIGPKEAEAAPTRLTERLTAMLAQIQDVKSSAASFSTPAVASRA